MSLLDNIFVNWRIVSKVPEGGRICTTTPGQVSLEENNNYMTAIWRSLTGDSRTKTVKFLQKLMSDTVEICDNMINVLFVTSKTLNSNSNKRQSSNGDGSGSSGSSNGYSNNSNANKTSKANVDNSDILKLNERAQKMEQLEKLSRELRNAKKGIANLHVTYDNDAFITAKLEEIIDKIETQSIKIDKSLKIIN